MQAEAILAALAGALTGGGGMRFLGRAAGPERDTQIAKYYREVIDGLRKENTELRDRVTGLEQRIADLETSSP